MYFDKDGIKLLKMGYKHYPKAFKVIFFVQFFLLIIISSFSQIPEIVPFGYELGYFIFPISSSIIVGFIIHFLTSYLDYLKSIINSYRMLDRYFEGIRRAIRNVFISFSQDKQAALNIDFYAINIEECLNVEFSDVQNINTKVMAYNGVDFWQESSKSMVMIQFYNDLKNRYNFDSLNIDPQIKRRYLDIVTIFENNIMPKYSNEELAIQNFYYVLKPTIQILNKGNNLLFKDLLFNESMKWYISPPKLGGNCENKLTIII